MNEILGNERIKEYISSALQKKRNSHAYIIEGEKGSGKKLIAEYFAAALQCEKGGSVPCGTCSSCIRMKNRNHPDVIRVRHEKPRTISVDDIREQVVNTVDIRPYDSPYKIYIIDEAEKMNISAQNAILKTVEEPPEYGVIFFLTVNKGIFLDTILSRCVHLNTQPVDRAVIRLYLESHLGLSGAGADFAAGYAMGNVGKAVRIASSEEFSLMKEQLTDILKSVHEAPAYEIMEKAGALKAAKGSPDDMLEMMRIWFRDLMILKATENTDRLVFSEEWDILKRQADSIGYDGASRIFDQIGKAEDRIRANVNADNVFIQLFNMIYGEFKNRKDREEIHG